jgi:hypothetical protein
MLINRGVMKRTLVYTNYKLIGTVLALILTVLGGQALLGEVDSLGEEVKAHQFLVGPKKSAHPVVGVKSENQVYVELPDKSRDVVRPDSKVLRIVEKSLVPVGRLTICGTKGRSERETRIDTDIVAEMMGRERQLEMGETVFTFDIVSDRVMKDAYVVLFLYPDDRPDDISIDFGSIGDLPAGEVVSREIFFPNTSVAEGMSYRFEFYSNGSPLEMYMLNQVACNPASRGLTIPWESRLNCYLNTGKKDKMTENPRPWRMGIKTMDLEAYRSRGAKDLRIKIKVKADGNVDLLQGDPRLKPQEYEALKADIDLWQFFPELKKGKPQDKLVAVPLKM